MSRSLLISTALTALAALVALTAAPPEASACGGTFCDVGPQSMPVDQSGETILFVVEPGLVEAHVQIDYEGDPENFAWIVPIMAEPEVSVGSQILIDEALDATVPTFVLNSRFEGDCGGGRPGLACAAVDVAAFDGEGGLFEEEPEEPTLRARDVVGAYEYAVLAGGTVDGIGQWLDDNGYARDDQAPEILGTYLDEGFMFVAFKLRPGAGVDQIHPVVLRYAGTEPCIPLRLTRIAAVEDMKIRALFLGDARVVPTNYRHVQLNPLRFSWTDLGANYEQVVREAVDVEGADGRAFVTEYAGPSSVVDTNRVRGFAWRSEAFASASADTLSEILGDQGFIDCVDFGPESGCQLGHPLLLPLLLDYFPPPSEVDPQTFYQCTSCYEVDQSEWDPAGFVIAFEEQVLGPGEHAQDILYDNAYLTRLYTVISPGEMTTDPLFHERHDLPEVSNQWTATRVNHCEDNDRLELDAGYTVYLDDAGNEPNLGASAALQVEEIPPTGAPVLVVDAQREIHDELAAWNSNHAPDSGCECRASRRGAQGAGWLGLLLLLGLRARARRRGPGAARASR